MQMGVASRPPEYEHFTVETGKTAYTFASQCMYLIHRTNSETTMRYFTNSLTKSVLDGFHQKHFE